MRLKIIRHIKNIFNLDLNTNLDDQLENIKNQKYELRVITDIFEVTDDIYNLLGNLNEMLTNDGKILINSINTKWNLFLLTFETLKFKKISRARSYIHLKKIYSISESSGYEIVRSFTRQIFPFKLFKLGDLINKFLEIIFFKFNLGINNYLLLTKNKLKQTYSKLYYSANKEKTLNVNRRILL